MIFGDETKAIKSIFILLLIFNIPWLSSKSSKVSMIPDLTADAKFFGKLKLPCIIPTTKSTFTLLILIAICPNYHKIRDIEYHHNKTLYSF